MTKHPASEPMISLYGGAKTEAERVHMILRTPHDTLRQMVHVYQATLSGRTWKLVHNYIDYLNLENVSQRDSFGRLPRWIEEQAIIARHDLCIVAGTVKLPDTENQPTAPNPPGG